MDYQEASKIISDKLDKARRLILECETLANENSVPFSFQVSYGMGGTYVPDPKKAKDWEDSGCEWESSNCYEENYGWSSSSQNC